MFKRIIAFIVSLTLFFITMGCDDCGCKKTTNGRIELSPVNVECYILADENDFKYSKLDILTYEVNGETWKVFFDYRNGVTNIKVISNSEVHASKNNESNVLTQESYFDY